ncbi:molecular chaperone DnaJ [Patescibacteria group bacterium]|nr:molecular chaperone DnaJ [Patescibacteria group bacterium]MBU1705928.1 molecular chaperone DnaJ [Patescibacteria group bacterium]
MSKDYYQTLGVGKGASQDEIKRAFRKLAHQYHPDKPTGNEAKFKEANEAYQVLGDEKKRAQYDQFGSAAFDGSAGGGYGQGFGGFSGFSQNINMDDLGDIFGDMFGFSGRAGSGFAGGGRQTRRGHDIRVDADLSFKESVFGKEIEFSLTKPSACARCGGVGAEPGTKMKTCDDCQGSGVKVTTHRTMLGNLQQKTACPTCAGEGEIPETQCSECAGSGLTNSQKTLNVNIPAGVDDGVTLRVRGQGEAVKGGPDGDLFVRIHVKPDPDFQRQDHTIISQVDLGFTQAALGDKIEVKTIDGSGELKIPAGTQSGTQFRLKGKGVPGRHGRGDQIIIANVVTPKKLSREQKKLLEQLDLR